MSLYFSYDDFSKQLNKNKYINDNQITLNQDFFRDLEYFKNTNAYKLSFGSLFNVDEFHANLNNITSFKMGSSISLPYTLLGS